VPTTDTSIIAGKNTNIGFRIAPAPEVKYSAIIPTAATIIATGNRRASGFAGTAFGRSGGASTPISPTGTGGVESRGSRMNSIGLWTRKRSTSFHPQAAKIAAHAQALTGLR
jgi:hypothetical protein